MQIKGPLYGQARVCEPILRELKSWFGIESAVQSYLAQMETLPTFLAEDGFLVLKPHYPESWEILVMGVGQPRRGTGSALLRRGEEWLREQGARLLQVKTLAETVDYEPYARTRAFYRARGFFPLEIFPTLWDPGNPCLLLVKAL